MIAVDLFAGAGGLGEGLATAGFEVAAAVELHPQAALTYAFNHPATTVLFGDIRELRPTVLLEAITRRTAQKHVDLVAGGPPCQGFSTAGKKNEADPRNSMFHHFAAVVATLTPTVFLLENVPGFKRLYGGAAYSSATTLFRSLGYEMTDCVLNAADYGVPQRRSRFVMAGWLPGQVQPFEWPPVTHSKPPALLLEPYVTAGEALDDIAFLKPGWAAHRHQRTATSAYQQDRRAGCELLFNHLATRHRERAQEIFRHIGPGRTISGVPELIKSAKRTMARLHADEISNAVLALPDDLIHYSQDRIPTVREQARLQTFDDDYVFWGKRTSGFMERRVDVPQYTQVGNAVPVLLGRAIGRAILGMFGEEPHDARHVEQRRERHAWVQGSSGYSGYSLSPAAQGRIDLFDVKGNSCELPLADEKRVQEHDPLAEWKVTGKSSHSTHWVPSVRATNPDELFEPA